MAEAALDEDIAIRVRNLSKVYRNVRVGAQDSSLKAQLGAFLKPWRLFMGVYRHENWSDDIHALCPVSFDVPRGQKLGIVGRNGSGKSTLLKILARITLPSTGEAEIRGSVAAMLEVGSGFHPELTGRENVFLNGAILGLKRRYIQEHMAEIVAFSELEDFMDLPVKRYSSGMRVRLAFAVSAHLASEILLVDEVLAVGDQAFRAKCVDKMNTEAASGRTIVLVTHNMDNVRRFCDRVLHLHQGELIFDGPAEEGIESYQEHCGERRSRGHV